MIQPASTPACRVFTLPYSEDPLAVLADTVIDDHAQTLPDLSRCCVLLPAQHAVPRLRQHLLAAATTQCSALLGPEITTLQQWAITHGQLHQPLIDDHSRELLLFNALQRHTELFGNSNTWSLVDELIGLFDALTLNQIQLPQEIDSFLASLQQAYGLPRTLAQMGREARMVHTLWHAWQQDLHAGGALEPCAAYAHRLKHSLEHTLEQAHFYLAGFSRLTALEADWLRRFMARYPTTLIIQGSAATISEDYPCHPGAVIGTLAQQLSLPSPTIAAASPYSQLLDAVYAHPTTALKQRAQDFARDHPDSPARTRLRLLAADSAEEEARAVDLQVRQWLLENKQTIAIVTENRRFARRVRALLERAGISITDAAGWALSTTSAATALERWLQVIEEDFAYRPLLDLLKSPFILPEWERSELLAAVYRLEQDIIQHENITRNLGRYRRQIRSRAARLSSGAENYSRTLLTLLDQLEQAALPLQPLAGNSSYPVTRYLQALMESLQHLGLQQTFDNDDAGQRILQELDLMRGAELGAEMPMSWLEFRTWLGRTLERYNFQPPGSGSRVTLLSLKQSQLLRGDALIIAGAERGFLNTVAGDSPFFNDAVRRDLGLDTSLDHINSNFHHFRRLLESADSILITRRRQQDGEDIPPSPWVERLNSFHQLAYQQSLDDHWLKGACHLRETQVVNSDPVPPAGKRVMPRPVLPEELLPTRLSASGYQQVVDCPYQFYAARCLKLSPPETVREALEKADYGEHVHRCLEAFHSDVSGLPGPFEGKLAEQREAAINCLNEISQAVFAADLEDNFEHRGWLTRWQALIPRYIDWQAQRQQHWHMERVEARITVELTPTLSITGRLDRIDQHLDGHHGVIDYKTGKVPREQEVRNGEAVQLPFYALLAEDIAAVNYLSLDKNSFGSRFTLEGAALGELKQLNRQRLTTVFEQLQVGASLPAWGDDATCTYCPMNTLCRRDAWSQENRP